MQSYTNIRMCILQAGLARSRTGRICRRGWPPRRTLRAAPSAAPQAYAADAGRQDRGRGAGLGGRAATQAGVRLLSGARWRAG